MLNGLLPLAGLGLRPTFANGIVASKCFGPEYNFGHVMGDYYDEQVLIIKTAWGGKAIGRSFLPPSSPMPTEADFKAMAEQKNKNIRSSNERNKVKTEADNKKTGKNRQFKPQPLVTAEEMKKPYGHYYREMMREVKDTFDNISTLFPGYK